MFSGRKDEVNEIGRFCDAISIYFTSEVNEKGLAGFAAVSLFHIISNAHSSWLHWKNSRLVTKDKLLACIHCGLCLEACPTYVITGNENDGPRGRLYLMRAVAEGRLEKTSNAFATHIDRCLGCRACEQVCPAGVEYGQLLEASREVLLEAQPKSDMANRLLRFVLRHVWLSPTRLRLFFGASRLFRDLGFARVLLKSGLARLISPRAEFGIALLESSQASVSRKDRRGAKIGTGAKRSACLRAVLVKGSLRVSIARPSVCCSANNFAVEMPTEPGLLRRAARTRRRSRRRARTCATEHRGFSVLTCRSSRTRVAAARC